MLFFVVGGSVQSANFVLFRPIRSIRSIVPKELVIKNQVNRLWGCAELKVRSTCAKHDVKNKKGGYLHRQPPSRLKNQNFLRNNHLRSGCAVQEPWR